MELTLRQKKQATLLYHYASLEYLKPIHGMVNAIIKDMDATLQLANDQGRDRLMLGELGWEMRDTSANWSTYAFPALLDLQKDVAEDISLRAFEVYGSTGVYNCQRTIHERSMNWATPDEEERFVKQMEALASYAYPIDKTLGRPPQWSDDVLNDYWQKTKANFPRIPQFRLREDVLGESDKKPPRTGVYAPLDDPYGALQFAWTGNNYGELCDCTTFNQMGLDAIHAVGHENLWNDSPQLMAFLLNSQYSSEFKKKKYFNECDAHTANRFMYNEAFVNLPRKWVFVEMLTDAYEDLPDETVARTEEGRLKGYPNEVVPKTGWWGTPALKEDAWRYFKQGEHFPATHTTSYGSVIWSYDPTQQQEPPKK